MCPGKAEAGWPRKAVPPAPLWATIPLGQGGHLVPAGRPAVPAAVVWRSPMRVRIELLRWSEPILVALRKDGWAVESVQGGTLSACHPQAPDERAARSRLHGPGLLASGSLRIEFCRAGPREPAAQG